MVPKLMRLVLFQNNNLKNQNKSDILSRLNFVFQMFFLHKFGKNSKNNSNNFNNNNINNNKYNNNDDENDIIFLLSNLLLEGLIILFRFNLDSQIYFFNHEYSFHRYKNIKRKILYF